MDTTTITRRKPGPKPGSGRNLAHVAELARWAHSNGYRISVIVAQRYDISERAASALVSRARRTGHDVPYDLGANQWGGAGRFGGAA